MVTPFKDEARKFNLHAAELLVEEWNKDCPEGMSFSIEGTGIMSPEVQAEIS